MSDQSPTDEKRAAAAALARERVRRLDLARRRVSADSSSKLVDAYVERRSTRMESEAGLPSRSHRVEVDERSGLVRIGEAGCDGTDASTAELRETLRGLSPWRKGPFEVDGVRIDAEWRSELKWERLKPYLRSLKGQSVCDVGCNNGYYMFRVAEQGPRRVLGVDPTALYASQFRLLNEIAGVRCLDFEPLGVDDLDLYPKTFDVVLLMGILYHHTDPISVLRTCAAALRRGGELVIETIVVPGEEPVAYVPERRYAGASGFYFLPTVSCLEHWIQRSSLRVVRSSPLVPTTGDEQRATEWRTGQSLADGLDPADPTRTIEGLPAPLRGIWVVSR